MDLSSLFLNLKDILGAILAFYLAMGDLVYQFYANNSRLIFDVIHSLSQIAFYTVLAATILLTIVYLVLGTYIILTKPRKHLKQVPNNMLPHVTVQIPTFNELAAITCAKKCLLFDYPKFDIIIGDDSNDPSVSAKIDQFALANRDKVSVTRRGSNKGFKPGNLNYMLPRSKGEIIVIFDSDFLPSQTFLKQIVSPMAADPAIAGVQSRWVMKNFSQNSASVIGSLIPMMTHHIGLAFLSRVGGNTFIAGSAEAVRKKDLIAAGGWESGSLTEDIEYSMRLIGQGKRIVYLEETTCQCEAPFTVKDLCGQQRRWAYGVIKACKGHFFRVVLNTKIPIRDKIGFFLLSGGYLMTFSFFLLTLFGFLSIITHRPEAIIWGIFIMETLRNIFLTSGFLVATILLMLFVKKWQQIPQAVLASYTIGLLVILIVSTGIIKAIFNRPMGWVMLRKAGNELSL